MTLSGRWAKDDMRGARFHPNPRAGVPRPRRPRRHSLDLAWLRYDLGLTQQRVADLFGISVQKLGRIENDHGTVEEIVAVHVLLNAYGLMHRRRS